jgi:hypothetical protein
LTVSGSDHRRRMLEHQERIEAEKEAGQTPLPAPKSQLDIPLIGTARPPEDPALARRKRRAKKPVQPRFGGI